MGIRLSLLHVLPAACLSILVLPAHAEITDPGKLESLKQELDTSVERSKALEAKAKQASDEIEQIKSRLVVAAAKVQASEKDVSASEDRLTTLDRGEAELLAELDQRRGEMADLLVALIKLGRHPPPALAVRPDDALSAMRSAVLMGTAVPELAITANKLKTRLDALARLRQQILAERDTLSQARNSLSRDQAALEKLLTRKVALQKDLAQEVETEQARATRLAREATDLTDLISKLETSAAEHLPQSRPDRSARAAVAEPAPRTGDLGLRTGPSPEAPSEAPAQSEAADTESRTALLVPPHPAQGLPSSRLFSQAKGLIRSPAAGLVLSGFGEPNSAGGKKQGLTIATRPGAQIIAPFDGKIAFAGPFRRYGQLLIISVGEGYHILLAGMTNIDATTGQSVLAGEPIGSMETKSSSGNTEEEDGSSRSIKPGKRPSLYIEFRKDGVPIDPRPWLMLSDRKVSG